MDGTSAACVVQQFMDETQGREATVFAVSEPEKARPTQLKIESMTDMIITQSKSSSEVVNTATAARGGGVQLRALDARVASSVGQRRAAHRPDTSAFASCLGDGLRGRVVGTLLVQPHGGLMTSW